MRDQRGIGLIEVMVAAGIFGGLVVAFMKLSDQMVKAEARMFELMEIQELTQTLRYKMSNPFACTNTFLTAFPDRKIPIDGELLSFLDKNGKALAQAGFSYGPVLLEEITFNSPEEELFKYSDFPGVAVFTVNLRFRGTRSKNLKKTQTVTVPILGEYLLDEKKFKMDYCDSLSSPFAEQIVDLTMKRICQSMEAVYDPKTGECDMGSAMADLMKSGGLDFSKLMQQMLQQK